MDIGSNPDAAGPSAFRDEVLGLAGLLSTAKASAELGRMGEACVTLLGEGIRGLLERNGLSHSDIARPLNSAELMPTPTLLRVLDYARAEAIEPLNDQILAGTLARCIALVHADRLLQADVLSRSSVVYCH